MNVAPRIISLVLILSACLWTAALSASPYHPFRLDAAVVVSIGLLMFSLISVVGLLLPRGRWARNLGHGVIVSEILLALVTPLHGWTMAALLATGAGIVALNGKWLNGWLRHFSSADGPSLRPMLLMIGCLGLTPAIGIVSPSGLQIFHGVLAAVGILAARGYSKAQMWGLWVARLGLIPLGIIAAQATSVGGGTVLVVYCVLLTGIAWSRSSMLAILPMLDRPAGPRRLGPRHPAQNS